MNKKQIVKQVAKKLDKLQVFKLETQGVQSWIAYMRGALGMSLRQLGDLVGLDKSNIHRLEKAESSGQVTLSSLRKLADGMDCDLVYAFIPRKGLELSLRMQAEKKANQILSESHLHMEYEDQAVGKEQLASQFEDLVEQLIYSKNLWDK